MMWILLVLLMTPIEPSGNSGIGVVLRETPYENRDACFKMRTAVIEVAKQRGVIPDIRYICYPLAGQEEN